MDNGESVAMGAVAAAVLAPLSVMDCGEPAALSLTESAAEKVAPEVAGVKVTEMVQAFPAATVVPQLLVCAKAEALAPVMENAMPVSAPLPLLVSVAVIAEDVTLAAVTGKLKPEPGLRMASGVAAEPVPDTLMV
jgi:hypothetical protein